LRSFKDLTDNLELKETKKEYLARRKREVSRAARAGLDEPPESSRKSRSFNLNTPKMHSPGDYVPQIRYLGPIDNHSTQAGEHEHRRSKTRFKRVSKRDFESQLVKLDVREAELLRMDDELRAAGVFVPSAKAKAPAFADERSFDPSFHHSIAANQHTPIYLQDWVSEHENDPAIANFVTDLNKYLLARVRQDDRALEDLNYTMEDLRDINIENDKIFDHKTLRINFTTYDIRRDQDVVNPSGDKRFVMVKSQADDTESQSVEDAAFNLFWFAEVLGIYHANVFVRSTGETQRFDFLWVRWLGNEPDNNPGARSQRLMKLGYVQNDKDQIPFGFLDPAHVVRGCHLIPAFNSGRTRDLLDHSFIQTERGDWTNFYVNEFVDRDMRVRFLQLGVGHIGYRRSHMPSGDAAVDYEFSSESAPPNEARAGSAADADQSNDVEDLLHHDFEAESQDGSDSDEEGQTDSDEEEADEESDIGDEIEIEDEEDVDDLYED